MPIATEAIQGFLMRAGMKFGMDDQGETGHFMLSFRTKRYKNPDGEKSLMMLITVGESGRYLEIAAMNMYNTSDAKSVGALAEYLLSQNYRNKIVRFELDRADGEIRAAAEAAPMHGSITFHAFMRMLSMFPALADQLHPTITKIQQTGRLPRPDVRDKRLEDLVRRAGGVEALEALVRQKKEQADGETMTLEDMMEMHLRDTGRDQPIGDSDEDASAPEDQAPPSTTDGDPSPPDGPVDDQDDSPGTGEVPCTE